MPKMIGRNTNTYDEVNAPLEIAINDTTYTEALPANPARLGYKITQIKRDILVKEMGPDNPDHLDRGFEVLSRVSYESKVDNIPVSAISIKSLNGNTTVLVVEE
jgi:hypothetical protein